MIPYMNSLNSHWAPFQTYLNKLNWTAIYNVRSWLNQLRSMAHIEHGPCWFPCQKKSSFNIVTHATCDKKNIQKISLGKYMILTTLATWSTLHTAHGSHHPKRGGSNFLVTQKIMSPVWWWFVILQGFFFFCIIIMNSECIDVELLSQYTCALILYEFRFKSVS